MFHDPFQGGDSVQSALDALGDLEQNTDHAILAKRSSERLTLRTPIELRPGNASQRFDFKIQGVTADVSSGGTQALLKQPILAGDYFLMRFNDHADALGDVLVRCMRCRLVQEEVFEVGLQFEHDIDTSALLPRHAARPAAPTGPGNDLDPLAHF